MCYVLANKALEVNCSALTAIYDSIDRAYASKDDLMVTINGHKLIVLQEGDILEVGNDSR